MSKKTTSSAPKSRKFRVRESSSYFDNFDYLKNEYAYYLEYLEDLNSHDGVKLSTFLIEYRQLFNNFLTVYENENRLHEKKKDLEEEIFNISKSIKSEMENEEREIQHIDVLKHETDRQKDQIVIVQDELKNERMEIMKLKGEIDYLTKLFSKEYGLFNKKFHSEIKLAKSKHTKIVQRKDILFKEVRELKNTDTQLQKENYDLYQKREEAQKRLVMLKGRLMSLKENIGKSSEEVNEKRVLLEDKRKLNIEKTEELNRSSKKLIVLKKKVEEMKKEENEKLELMKQKDLDIKSSFETERETKLNRDKCITNNAKYSTTKEQILEQIKAYENKTKENINNGNKLVAKKFHALERRKKLQRVKEVKLAKKNEVNLSMEKLNNEILNIRKGIESCKFEVDDVVHQKNALIAQTRKGREEEINKHGILHLLLTQKRNLIQNITMFQKESEINRKNIYLLEEQRKNYSMMIGDIYEKCENVVQRKKVLEFSKSELEKKIEEERKNYKRHLSLYEEVENDRNSLFKKLSRVEMLSKDQSKKFTILLNTIKQVKTEIVKRDKNLQKLAYETMQLRNENKRLKTSQENLEKSESRIRSDILEKENEVNKLNNVIRDTHENTNKQKRELDVLVNERDILGNHLLQRNSQIMELYKEMKLNQNKINTGNYEYRKKLDKIEDMKNRMETLDLRVKEISQLVEKEREIKLEVNQYRKKLVKVKMKLTALLEESNISLNVHRYRKLRSTNPEIYEKVQKVQDMDKELFMMSKKLCEINFLIKEKEILYKQIKKVLNRQPTMEDNDQFKIIKRNLTRKKKQIKQTKKNLQESKQLVGAEKINLQNLEKEYERISKLFKKRYLKKELTK